MKTVFGAGLIGLALFVPCLATSQYVFADNVTVGIGSGGIAFGYSDGYWDRDHQWHAWKDKDEAGHFRAANQAHYIDRKHDAEPNKGWRENDRYWEQH